jgi:hypothetical protein
MRRIIGDMSDHDRVLLGLDLVRADGFPAADGDEGRLR